ncbi:MAG TPA: hypothetical protein VJ583_08705 [Nitrososphaeraceae archaeon]|nr:hypothetical protein [Nitrososphaeraceae archaeon]
MELLSLNNIDNYDLLQNINAENTIENNKYNIKKQIISKNKNNHHGPDDYISIGAWAPLNNNLILQHLKEEEQKNAIQTLLNQGFHEYYFSMHNFEDSKYTKLIEDLLKAVEKTNLKIIIILLPPSEGDSNTNYDWKGWIKYFNSLEKKYPKSFEGFTIDDFNWISTKEDTKFENNIDFMENSNLIRALEDKDKDVKFYPTIYFEGRETDIVATKYDDFTDGFIVASGCYYNVSLLEKELTIFKEIFEKPIKYVIYPTITYNYSTLGYNPPTEQLIQATLSITTNSIHGSPATAVDGLIIWRDIDNSIIRNYLVNQDSKQFLAKISKAKELQIREEEKQKMNAAINNGLVNESNVKNDSSCYEWSIRYNKAYDKWKDLTKQEKEKNNWKKEILQILEKDYI